MDRAGLIDSLTTAFAARLDVVEVAIDGSLGRHGGDAHSDVDLVVTVAEEGDVAALNAAVPGILHATCEPIMIRVFPFVITFVTREWLRADVTVRAASWPTYEGPDPAAKAQQIVDELFRCFGLAPIVTARGEWESSVVGTGMMVGLLAELMQLENGTLRVGGALRLSERLTPDQRIVIGSLPPIHADAESAAATHDALLRDFLPRARRIASQFGFEYPVELEHALLAHLARQGLAG